MHISDMLDLLNGDLANEYKHWHFYINAAMRIQGPHRNHLREWLLEEAAGEASHVRQFGDLIIGLGGTPGVTVNSFANNLTDAKDILNYALSMEDEVVRNYVQRQNQAEEMGGVPGTRISVFLDDQIQDSADDADHIRQMIAGL